MKNREQMLPVHYILSHDGKAVTKNPVVILSEQSESKDLRIYVTLKCIAGA